ncbi:MAG: YjhG/YagF family D-xylonate dehydratase [bacterium]|nr:YjhG/YagF family D-xylonate dehydratase [bacterium]
MTVPEFLNAPESIYSIRSKAPGPEGVLPLTGEMLRNSPSGDVFALTENAGMGWRAEQVNHDNVLILSTLGGLRADDGTPIALGYHTGHWELGLLIKRAAETLKELDCLPFAGYCSDPCDGRSQGTTAMMESLPYRNTAAEAFGRLVRSLPTRRALIGVATCDKGLPAMMMALAETKGRPAILIPGGVTLPAEDGEDAGTVQSIGVRYAHGEITLEEAAQLGCKACGSPGGGCQFLGTAASSQVIGEALGLSLPHTALVPSGEEAWLEMASASARAVHQMMRNGMNVEHVLTPGAFRNAMAVHAAVGGSTNLLLHLPAIAFCAGVERPSVDDWITVNDTVPRLVDVLPNGPENYRTVQVYLAGGVPEVMLQLRELGALDLRVRTVSGMTLEQNLDWWERSERRKRFKVILYQQDGVDPERIIMSPKAAAERGLTSTVIFPQGNLAPEGSVVKSTAIEAELCPGNVYFKRGTARVFTEEFDAIRAIKSTGSDRIGPDDVIVLICRGPMGAGMPETSQITSAIKYTKALHHLALLTDGRFSGFSSGPCIGHIGPEAMAGGPIGKVRDGDTIEIRIDRNAMQGNVNLIGEAGSQPSDWSAEHGTKILSERTAPPLSPDPNLPESVRLWAALQQAGGGTWGGCVYDVDAIIEKLTNR